MARRHQRPVVCRTGEANGQAPGGSLSKATRVNQRSAADCAAGKPAAKPLTRLDIDAAYDRAAHLVGNASALVGSDVGAAGHRVLFTKRRLADSFARTSEPDFPRRTKHVA